MSLVSIITTIFNNQDKIKSINMDYQITVLVESTNESARVFLTFEVPETRLEMIVQMFTVNLRPTPTKMLSISITPIEKR